MSSSFRPIAPAMYAGFCNPPRRAKRQRSDESSLSSPPSQLGAEAEAAEAEAEAEHEQEPEPELDDDGDDQPPPKRRGRRPGTLSRAAREAQRKINHSLIEKARRTKINDALATLRELVPPEYKRDHDESDDDEQKPRPKPKAAGEKEFKLEILVRTVAYLQDLTERVKQLEHTGCPSCKEPISLTKDDPAPTPAPVPAPAPAPASTSLPSISTWLPSSSPPPIRTSQLPTPPTSATCPPSTFPMPPVLTLPSPRTSLPHMQPRFSGFRAGTRHSPASSPVYTPDDETAASLLLRISSTSPRTSTALTPSRLLGLSAER